jgi:hypothetical protein
MLHNMDNPDPSHRKMEGATTIPGKGVEPSGSKCSASASRMMIWSVLVGNGKLSSTVAKSRLAMNTKPHPTWRRIEGSTGYSLPTYSLQALFTAEPWKLVKITSIVNS